MAISGREGVSMLSLTLIFSNFPVATRRRPPIRSRRLAHLPHGIAVRRD